MDEAKYIAEYIAALEESVRYFSSENKDARECWVVRTFLENMNIRHEPEDIASPEQDPPDVVALGGNFEVKEILDSGRRRHKEFKEDLERAKTITDPQEMLTNFTPVDSSVIEIFQLCLAEIEKFQYKYPQSVRESLDLLFYVNLKHVFEIHEEPFPDVSALHTFSWRSISFVKGHIGCCFYAAPDAPDWLRDGVGIVHHKAWE